MRIVVPILSAARRLQVDAGRGAIERIQHAAMRHDRDRLARVGGGQLRHHGDDARGQLIQALAAGRPERAEALLETFLTVVPVELRLPLDRSLYMIRGRIAMARR